jgi:hypothetical protein
MTPWDWAPPAETAQLEESGYGWPWREWLGLTVAIIALAMFF